MSASAKHLHTAADGENSALFDQLFRAQSNSYNDQRVERCFSEPLTTSQNHLQTSSKKKLKRSKNPHFFSITQRFRKLK